MSSEYVSTNYLMVNNCGESVLNIRDTLTVREKGRKDYGVQFVESGLGYYDNDNIFNAGEVILHFPNVKQRYAFKKEDNSHLMWIHFTGELCKILDPLKSDKTVKITLSNPKEFTEIFDKMIVEFNEKRSGYETVCNGYLLVILQTLLRDAKDKNHSSGLNENLEKVILTMKQNYNKPIELDKYSKICFVSKSRFSHLFKDYTGFSPYNYQVKLRIEKAKELLTYSTLNVGECSKEVGFEDFSYFSRIFKKYTGYTPRQFKTKQD